MAERSIRSHNVAVGSFARNPPELNPITIENQIIELVSDVKVLGLNISNNLTNKHITELVKKASKRIYFLIQRTVREQKFQYKN